MAINRLPRMQEISTQPPTRLSHHVDQQAARSYVEARYVEGWVGEHLKAGCDWCHDLLYREMDRILKDHEHGRDYRLIPRWLTELGERYTSRHLCPIDLVEEVGAGDEVALRHLRHCPTCNDELQALDSHGQLTSSW